jgi:hypothetical protein
MSLEHALNGMKAEDDWAGIQEITLSMPSGICQDQRKNNPATCQSGQGIQIPFFMPGIFSDSLPL